MNTREQRYAAAIFSQVSNLPVEPPSYRTKYGSMAHKLPVLIRTAGLAQALAFVDARGGPEHHLLLDHLAQVLGHSNRARLLSMSRGEIEGPTSLSQYMRLSQQALDALLWYKRFAQSVLGVTGTEEPSLDSPAVETASNGGQQVGHATGAGR
jgi:CRISPR-associated protein Cmr5